MAYKQKRLTAVKFKKMLKDHPRFRLDVGTWICDTGDKKPCGGCAITLAYKAAHPSAKLNEISTNKIAWWAYDEFGVTYVAQFTTGFDCPRYAVGTGEGIEDGVACHKMAVALGRLEEEDPKNDAHA